MFRIQMKAQNDDIFSAPINGNFFPSHPNFLSAGALELAHKPYCQLCELDQINAAKKVFELTMATATVKFFPVTSSICPAFISTSQQKILFLHQLFLVSIELPEKQIRNNLVYYFVGHWVHKYSHA